MFSSIKNFLFGKETDMTFATIQPIGNRFGIVTRSGDVLGTYSRKRDATRGAARQGIVVY